MIVRAPILALALAAAFGFAGLRGCYADAAFAAKFGAAKGLMQSADYDAAIAAADSIAALAATSQERADVALLRGDARFRAARYGDAKPLLEDAVRLAVEAGGEASQRHADALTSLGADLRALDDYPGAQRTFDRALAVTSQLASPDLASKADLFTSIGVLRYYINDLAGADAWTRKALDLRRMRTEDKSSVAQALDNLGTIIQSRGLLTEAQPLLDEALAIRRSVLRVGHADIANSLNNLGVLDQARGDFRKAEAEFREAMSIDQKAYGNENPQVLTDMQNLAETLRSLKELDEARDLHAQVLKLRLANVTSQHGDASKDLDLAVSYGNLANVLAEMGEDAEAAKDYETALAIDRARADGRPTRDVALSLNSLAEHYRKTHDSRAAETYQGALAVLNGADLPDDPLHAIIRFNLATADLAAGQFAEAEVLLRDVVARQRRLLPDDHPSRSAAEARLGLVLAKKGQIDAALRLGAGAMTAIAHRFESVSLALPPAAIDAESRVGRETLADYLLTLALAARPGERLPGPQADDAFEAFELIQSTSTAVIASKAAKRESSRPQTKKTLREIAETQERRELAARRDARAAGGLSTPEAGPDIGSVAELNERLASLEAALPRADDKRAPPFQDLTAFRSQLADDEAGLGFVVAEAETIVVAVSHADVKIRVSTLGREALKRQVDSLAKSFTWSDTTNGYPVFDLAAASALRATLLGDAEILTGAAQRLAVVADGPLTSIPLSVLVIDANARRGTSPASSDAYQAAKWFGDRYTIAVYPSFSTAFALRQVAERPGQDRTFVGFGNPLLAPVPSASAQAAADSDLIAKLLIFQGTATAFTDVRSLASLPVTHEHLAIMNKAFAGGTGEVFEGTRATKKNVEETDLAKFRYVAFATHGLLATETGVVAEPGLVLTPPLVPTANDDGILSATDIGGLHLNADLVLLSACNTASPRRGFGADGLSGIARAFFQAGAKAVLISHWSVEAHAVTALLQHMLSDNKPLMSQALADAQRQVRLDPAGLFAHPAYWAPFSLVGDAQSVAAP